MTDTPSSIRLHIALFGERNSGKSSLLNSIAGQQVSIVSDVPGTTTDHISKAMELPGLGACILTDTAGIDDCGELGAKRVESSLDALRGADIAVAVVDAQTGRIPALPEMKMPVVAVINKCDAADIKDVEELSQKVKAAYGSAPVKASALNGDGIKDVLEALQKALPQDWDALPLTAGIINEGETAMLVMPQDKQAPKGRLILPQQQTIRELLDRRCRIVCCTTEMLSSTLEMLKEAPAAIITDAQDYAAVHKLAPAGTRLTSFSMLQAASKGDIEFFKKSVKTIDSLTSSSKVLIAEACTHVPATEDIGRVKIPRLLRSRAGEGLKIDIVGGHDFPQDLSGYDLVIHCGACMFNRRYVLSRVEQAKRQGVPMTNYGVTIAYINNLL